jgi:hypothetical protein
MARRTTWKRSVRVDGPLSTVRAMPQPSSRTDRAVQRTDTMPRAKSSRNRDRDNTSAAWRSPRQLGTRANSASGDEAFSCWRPVLGQKKGQIGLGCFSLLGGTVPSQRISRALATPSVIRLSLSISPLAPFSWIRHYPND